MQFLARITRLQFYFVLLVGILLLAAANIIDLLFGRPFWIVTSKIHLGIEQTISTWYSSVLLACAATMAFLCFRVSVLKGIKPAFAWPFVAAMLLFLSCDEVATLHESIGHYLNEKIIPSVASEWKHTGWQILLGPVAVAIAVVLSGVLWTHLRGAGRTGLYMLTGCIVLLGSGIGLETTIEWLNHYELETLSQIQIIVEEIGEMTGSWLIGFGLMRRVNQLERLPPNAPDPSKRSLSN